MNVGDRVIITHPKYIGKTGHFLEQEIFISVKLDNGDILSLLESSVHPIPIDEEIEPFDRVVSDFGAIGYFFDDGNGKCWFRCLGEDLPISKNRIRKVGDYRSGDKVVFKDRIHILKKIVDRQDMRLIWEIDNNNSFGITQVLEFQFSKYVFKSGDKVVWGNKIGTLNGQKESNHEWIVRFEDGLDWLFESEFDKLSETENILLNETKELGWSL